MQKLRISSPRISTPCVSTSARPGLVVVRTFAPYWPGAAPAQVRWPLSSMKPEPSSATNVAGAPPRHAFDPHRSLDGGQQRGRPDDVRAGALGIDLDAEAAGCRVVALDRPAQRALAVVGGARDAQRFGLEARFARSAGGEPDQRARPRRRRCARNSSSRIFAGSVHRSVRAARTIQGHRRPQYRAVPRRRCRSRDRRRSARLWSRCAALRPA